MALPRDRRRLEAVTFRGGLLLPARPTRTTTIVAWVVVGATMAAASTVALIEALALGRWHQVGWAVTGLLVGVLILVPAPRRRTHPHRAAPRPPAHSRCRRPRDQAAGHAWCRGPRSSRSTTTGPAAPQDGSETPTRGRPQLAQPGAAGARPTPRTALVRGSPSCADHPSTGPGRPRGRPLRHARRAASLPRAPGDQGRGSGPTSPSTQVRCPRDRARGRRTCRRVDVLVVCGWDGTDHEAEGMTHRPRSTTRVTRLTERRFERMRPFGGATPPPVDPTDLPPGPALAGRPSRPSRCSASGTGSCRGRTGSTATSSPSAPSRAAGRSCCSPGPSTRRRSSPATPRSSTPARATPSSARSWASTRCCSRTPPSTSAPASC